MYYMTIPQLYEKVALRSYPELRYVEGRPEGFGAGSPFCMALSGLATNNTSTLVKDFRVCGTWPEPRREDYHKGLVPDSTMLLGISLRAVIDKMANITTFRYDGLTLCPNDTPADMQKLGARHETTEDTLLRIGNSTITHLLDSSIFVRSRASANCYNPSDTKPSSPENLQCRSFMLS